MHTKPTACFPPSLPPSLPSPPSQELKAKDDQYVKHLKKQAEDVDLILERMEEQARVLLRAYHQELEQIESAFTSERKKLKDTHRLAQIIIACTLTGLAQKT